MLNFILFSLIVAELAAFILTLAEKWGIIEWLQVNGSELINKWASCDFCKCFWFCVIVSAIVGIWAHDPLAVFYPLVSTKIAQKIL